VCCFGFSWFWVGFFPWLSKFTFGDYSKYPAGFVCLVHYIQLYLMGVVSFLFHNELHIRLHQSY
jgi:hypothetical protein